MKIQQVIGVFLLMVLAGCQPNVSEPQLLRVPFESVADNVEHEYFVYLPKGYGDDDKQWPVMMFLHGNGERGDGLSELDYVLIHGPLYEAWVQKRDLPFIIISPQLPKFDIANDPEHYINTRQKSSIPKRLTAGVPQRDKEGLRNEPISLVAAKNMDNVAPLLPQGWEMIEQDLLGMLEHVHNTYQTDTTRTYLTGLSYGGFGTWFMASQHPDKFAAVAPVAGWGHPSLVTSIAEHKLPVWAFAGGKDPVIDLNYFYPGIQKMHELGHQNVRFTVHQNAGHDVWRRVYQSNVLYDWMLSFDASNID